MEFYIPQEQEVIVRIEGLDVVLISNGETIGKMKWDGALKLSRAIRTQAKKIERIVKAPQIISDQAVLMRSGAPFGLTNNPAMLKEAGNEAYHNAELRKYMTGKAAGGIESRGVVGTPTFI